MPLRRPCRALGKVTLRGASVQGGADAVAVPAPLSRKLPGQSGSGAAGRRHRAAARGRRDDHRASVGARHPHPAPSANAGAPGGGRRASVPLARGTAGRRTRARSTHGEPGQREWAGAQRIPPRRRRSRGARRCRSTRFAGAPRRRRLPSAAGRALGDRRPAARPRAARARGRAALRWPARGGALGGRCALALEGTCVRTRATFRSGVPRCARDGCDPCRRQRCSRRSRLSSARRDPARARRARARCWCDSSGTSSPSCLGGAGSLPKSVVRAQFAAPGWASRAARPRRPERPVGRRDAAGSPRTVAARAARGATRRGGGRGWGVLGACCEPLARAVRRAALTDGSSRGLQRSRVAIARPAAPPSAVSRVCGCRQASARLFAAL